MKPSRATEDYLKTIWLLERRGGAVRGVDIAEELGVTKPTVSVSLKALIREGYAVMDGAHGVRLTQRGAEVGADIYERHQLFQALLTGLGVDKHVAAEDACRIEHALSPESYRALKGMAAAYMRGQRDGNGMASAGRFKGKADKPNDD